MGVRVNVNCTSVVFNNSGDSCMYKCYRLHCMFVIEIEHNLFTLVIIKCTVQKIIIYYECLFMVSVHSGRNSPQ